MRSCQTIVFNMPAGSPSTDDLEVLLYRNVVSRTMRKDAIVIRTLIQLILLTCKKRISKSSIDRGPDHTYQETEPTNIEYIDLF